MARIDWGRTQRRGLHLGVASLRVRAGAGYVQADPGTIPETQSYGVRVGIQRRHSESHGAIRASPTRSPLHESRGGITAC